MEFILMDASVLKKTFYSTNSDRVIIISLKSSMKIERKPPEVLRVQTLLPHRSFNVYQYVNEQHDSWNNI